MIVEPPGTPRSRARRRPGRGALPADPIQQFRLLLTAALDAIDDHGRRIGDVRWGCYAFLDYDREPLYVGQTNEKLRTRVRRHLTNQRSDAVAMGILDVREVAELVLWPLWHLQDRPGSDPEARRLLNSTEYTAYLEVISASRFQATLNEKIPPVSPPVDLPPSHRFPLVTGDVRSTQEHPDVRNARRATTLARLAAVAHERGEVSDGLRRALVVQAVRLTYGTASRLAHVEGRPQPDPNAINMTALIGNILTDPEDSLDSPPIG